NNADYIFAVGPKLFESAKDRNTKTGGKAKVFEFLPGLSKIEPIIEPQNTFSAISFGRIESDNDIIKQTGEIESYGVFPKGNINITNDYGQAVLLISINGKEKNIEVTVLLEKKPNESWKVTEIKI
nr:hypothetical protein [Paludibacteraceae bacterium]